MRQGGAGEAGKGLKGERQAARRAGAVQYPRFLSCSTLYSPLSARGGSKGPGRLQLPREAPPCACMQGGAGEAGRGFKGEREAARRAGAGNRAAWNTLFMRPDTVAAAVAEHFGVTRAELLDRDAAGGVPA